MANFKQIVLGAGLLTAAFFVGTYFKGEAFQDQYSITAEALQRDDLVWNSPQTDPLDGAADARSSESAPWSMPPARGAQQDNFPETFAQLPREVMPSFVREQPRPDDTRNSGLGSVGARDSNGGWPGPEYDEATRPKHPHLLAEQQPVPAMPGSYGAARSIGDLSPLANRAQRQVQLVVDSFQIHVVRPGESLPLIAQQYFGSPEYYLDIYLANQDVLASPAEVADGVSLKIPVYHTRR